MNAKSISLFSILFVLAAATHSPSKDVPKKDYTSSPDLHLILTDLSQTDGQAVSELVQLVSNYLGSDLEMDATDPAGRLAFLLSYNDYLFSTIKTQKVEVQQEAETILAGLPTVEMLKETHNGDAAQMKAALLKALNAASSRYLEVLRLANLHEWVTQLPLDTTDFEMTRYATNTKEFLRKVKEALKPMVKEFSKTDASAKDDITAAYLALENSCKVFYKNIGSWAKQIILAYKQPTVFVEEGIQEVFQNVMNAASDKEAMSAEELRKMADVAASRIDTLAQTLTELTLTRKDDQTLLALFDQVSYYAGPLPEENPLTGHADFHAFVLRVSQALLNAMLPAVHPDVVRTAVANFLTPEVEIYEGDRDIMNALRANYDFAPFRQAKADSSVEETVQKLRLLDLIVYNPVELPEERFQEVVRNTAVIATVSHGRIQLAQRLKYLFGVQGTEKFMSNLYDATLYCAASTPEHRLDADLVELFDECLDAARADQSWAATHYLAFKLFNLLFAEKTSAYQTTFAAFVDAEAEGNVLMGQLTVLPSIHRHLQRVVAKLGNSDARPESFFTFFMGKTFPSKTFHYFERSADVVAEKRDVIQTNANKINVKFVDDRLNSVAQLRRSGSLRGSSILERKPSSIVRKPSLKVYYDDQFTGEQVEEIQPVPETDNRLIKGQAENYVNMVVPKFLPADILSKLKKMKLADFVNSVDRVETTDGVEYTNLIVKVTRRDNPCYGTEGHRC